MLSSLVRIIYGNVLLGHFSSSFEKPRFYAEVELLVARSTNYIDAVVDFCSRRGIAVETMTPNRSEPTGYKVVRVRFKDGRPGLAASTTVMSSADDDFRIARCATDSRLTHVIAGAASSLPSRSDRRA